MTTYIEYEVKLTDGQNSKLVSEIRNKSPLTLPLKHSYPRGSDELMLTRRQIAKIKKITGSWNRNRYKDKPNTD